MATIVDFCTLCETEIPFCVINVNNVSTWEQLGKMSDLDMTFTITSFCDQNWIKSCGRLRLLNGHFGTRCGRYGLQRNDTKLPTLPDSAESSLKINQSYVQTSLMSK